MANNKTRSHLPSEPTLPNPDGLRILVIGSTYPRSDEDYAVPWMREAHARLTSRGHKVTMLAPSYRGLGNHRIDEVEVKRWRYAPAAWERLTHEQGAPNKIDNPLMQLLAIPYVICGCIAAAWLCLRQKFDVIHVHWPFPHEPIGWVASRVARVPLTIMCHGAEFALARRKPWISRLLRHSLRSADLIVANSTDTARQIKALSGCEALVLPYGSTVQAKDVHVPKNDRPRILFTGRLIERKGVDVLIQALPQVLVETKVDLYITGNGDQRERLEQLTTELGLEDHVKFLGFVSNEQLDQEYARCDVWVNPSVIDSRGDTEGLGVGSIEAYAHRKPVVASAVGGIPDTVEHGRTGYLVPERDEVALANAILELVNDPQKATLMGNAGLEFAQTRFNWDTITEQTEDVWRALCQSRTHDRSPERRQNDSPVHQRTTV